MNLIRFFHTIKHLKPVQVYGRLAFMLNRRFGGPSGCGAEADAAKELKRLYPLNNETSLEFEFLNLPQVFDLDNVWWQTSDWPADQQPEKLWLYQLHYFNWLFDHKPDIEEKLQLFLILDWIDKNRSMRTAAWEPYPTSKRLVNWVKWQQNHSHLVTTIKDCIDSSILLQLQRLTIDLEYHNQANHLFENLAAMLIASLYLLQQGTGLPATLIVRARTAANELCEQVYEQFFADGGHYERSPMYHHELLESIRNVKEALQNVLKEEFIQQTPLLQASLDELYELCVEKLPLLKDWLATMTHPDGLVAQFNDCTLLPGIKATMNNADKPENYLLEGSGFFVRRTPESYFALSCGEASPGFQPGHSHCDILSYELSLNGWRCIIDTGCGSYQNAQIRQTCRSSQSHNIALIELTEQSDIWGAFRMGKRARITNRTFDAENGLLIIEMLDQYDQAFRRQVIFAKNQIKIRDRMTQRRITGTFCSLIHLHPEIQILPANEDSVINLCRQDTEFSIRTSANFRTEVHEWYPDFGKSQRTAKLILSNHLTEAIDYVISWKT